jgi:hypothetical protein
MELKLMRPRFLFLSKREYLYVLIFYLSLHGYSQPQYWESIDNDDGPLNPRFLGYSHNLGLTIWLGCHRTVDLEEYIAGYNGSEWIVIKDSTHCLERYFVDFADGILVAGVPVSVGEEIVSSISYYDGESWTYPWHFNDNVRKLVWTNDTLFALGTFTEIDGVPIYNIAKLSGNEWVPMISETDDFSFSLFADIEYYEGYYYVGGNIEMGEGPDDFARINNGALEIVGDGLTGSFTGVSFLEVYDGELYAAGLIAMSQGNVGNHIVRWDGESIRDVGGPFQDRFGQLSTAGGITSMIVKDEYLFVSGGFHFTDGVPMFGAARWDGSQWCGLHTQDFAPVLPDNGIAWGLVNHQDTLILAANYEYEDGSSDFFWKYTGGDLVSECTEPLSTYRSTDPSEIKIYPNPSSGIFQISSQEQMERLRVRDAMGRVVSAQVLNTPQIEIDLSSHPTGLYFIEVQSQKGREVKKIVLE